MPWIIRNAQGQVCGRFTNRPGPDNKMPNGTPEVPEYIEEDTPEVLAFVNRPRVTPGRVQSLEERVLIAKGLATKADFEAEAAK